MPPGEAGSGQRQGGLRDSSVLRADLRVSVMLRFDRLCNAQSGVRSPAILSVLWVLLLTSVVRGQPTSFEELLDKVRAWEEVYTRGYHIKWLKYSAIFSPSGEVSYEEWADDEAWLDSPRARCERHAVVRESGEPVRRVRTTYVADGAEDRALSEWVGEDEKRGPVADVAEPGYFNVPLECGTPQGVLFQDSLVEALLRHRKAGGRIEIVGIEEHSALRSLVVDLVHGKALYEGDGDWDRLRIALDRNYICWSRTSQSWYYNAEEKRWSIACSHATVDDWMEYEPGVWFPTRWRSVGLSRIGYEEGSAYRGSELIGRLVSVERLEHGLSRKLLELRFPPGTVVHELGDAGKILLTYEVPEGVEERPQIRLLPLGLTALATFLLLALWYALRRIRRLQHD